MQFATFDKSPEYTLALQFSLLRERPKFLQNKKPLRIGTHPCFRSPSHILESSLGTEATFSVSIRKAVYSDEANFIVLEQWQRQRRDSPCAASAGTLRNRFLEDVRAYRQKQLKETGLEPIFPLWRQPTRQLANEMIAAGMRAKLTCVGTQQLDARFLGREFDERFQAELPTGVDPCGEKGEFHSFVYAGPMLNQEIPVLLGETVVRDKFVFADLMPASMAATPSSR